MKIVGFVSCIYTHLHANTKQTYQVLTLTLGVPLLAAVGCNEI